MAPIPSDDISYSSIINHSKRSDWASRNPGPILVFCIVFVVGLGIVLLFVYRKLMARKAAKQEYEAE